MRKKNIFVLAAVLVILAVFCGCSEQNAKAVKLSSAFDEAKVKTAAENAIKLINSGDYKKITDTMVREDLREQLSADILGTAVARTMGNDGETFVSFGNETVSGVEEKKVNYAVAVIAANYKNRTVTYTISFDTNMKLVGFYLK